MKVVLFICAVIIVLMSTLVIWNQRINNTKISEIRLSTINDVMTSYLGRYWPAILISIVASAAMGAYMG